MPFVRDTVPRKGNLRSLQSYLERTLERLDDWEREVSDRLLTLERLRAIVGIRIRYLWDDTIDTVATPAAAGFMKGNDAIEASITEFSISRFDDFGRLAIVDGIFSDPVQSGFFQVTDFTRGTIFIYDIAGPVTPRPTDVLVDVAFISGVGAPPQQGDLMEASYWPTELPFTTRHV